MFAQFELNIGRLAVN